MDERGGLQLTGDVSRAIASLYDAAAGVEPWEVAVKAVAVSAGAQSALLFTPYHPPSEGLFVSRSIDPAAFDAYAAYYHATDIWLHEGLSRGLLRPGQVLFGEELIPQGIFEGSEHYNDFLEPLDIRYLLVSVISNKSHPFLPHFNLSLFRPTNGAEFGRAEQKTFSSLVPHIERALVIRARMEGCHHTVQALTDVLQRLSTAVLLVQPDGRVSFANTAAETLLKAGDGLALRRTGVQAMSRDDDHALQRALRSAASGGPGVSMSVSNACTVSRPSGRRPFQIIAAPIVRRAILSAKLATGAMVFIIDPDNAPEVPVARIAHLLHLTGAEARLAAALASGVSLAEYAERTGVTLGTARWTLKQALAKTGADKQATLMALVLKTAIVRDESRA
jgi:DNA-binding CsgD family transcriptional regulator/PAS domain-containing protein